MSRSRESWASAPVLGLGWHAFPSPHRWAFGGSGPGSSRHLDGWCGCEFGKQSLGGVCGALRGLLGRAVHRRQCHTVTNG